MNNQDTQTALEQRLSYLLSASSISCPTAQPIYSMVTKVQKCVTEPGHQRAIWVFLEIWRPGHTSCDNLHLVRKFLPQSSRVTLFPIYCVCEIRIPGRGRARTVVPCGAVIRRAMQTHGRYPRVPVGRSRYPYVAPRAGHFAPTGSHGARCMAGGSGRAAQHYYGR
jgi:hypothetical protein